ncbi:hypothetical protein GCM10007147_41950 [Nocardiopsis kunsanensis]|uniref:Uncharacterized protein n=1 Tax=Nocardiopsis kunsanensis TaxID=141693 RepID=A0A918XKP0_9ACTN|nr:hypothetical protein GCM10007147_41950 [Nocardiopsis kunsanensis]
MSTSLLRSTRCGTDVPDTGSRDIGQAEMSRAGRSPQRVPTPLRTNRKTWFRSGAMRGSFRFRGWEGLRGAREVGREPGVSDTKISWMCGTGWRTPLRSCPDVPAGPDTRCSPGDVLIGGRFRRRGGSGLRNRRSTVGLRRRQGAPVRFVASGGLETSVTLLCGPGPGI